jgi:hypothetical protein
VNWNSTFGDKADNDGAGRADWACQFLHSLESLQPVRTSVAFAAATYTLVTNVVLASTVVFVCFISSKKNSQEFHLNYTML